MSKSAKRIGIDCYGTGFFGVGFLMSIGKNGPLGDYALFPADAAFNIHPWTFYTIPVALFLGIPIFGLVLNLIHMIITPSLPLHFRIPLMGGMGYLFFIFFNQNGVPILPFWLDMPVFGMTLIAYLLLFLGILALGTFLSFCGRFFASPLDTGKQDL
jgi:hypothetical protein